MTITSVNTGSHHVSRSALVQAPVAELFALVADPRRHSDLDGSGTVRDTVSGPATLSRGAKFSVKMSQYGVPYRITSQVTEFEPDRVVEWRHPAGHRWRWEFLAESAETTRVTETFDYSHGLGQRARIYELFGMPKKNAAGIEATLSNLQRRYSSN